MNITISGHGVKLTPALHNYITTKLERISRHFDQVVDMKVLLSVEDTKAKKDSHHVQCNICVKGKNIFAESIDADMYVAIDLLVDKLDKQIVDHKEKIKSVGKTSPKRHSANQELLPT